MAKINVTIDGKEYPIKMTMGAMLRFKQETGKEVSEIGDSLTDNATLIWCCIKSACAHDKVKFDISLMDFADSIEVSDVQNIVMALTASSSNNEEGEEGGGEKNAV